MNRRSFLSITGLAAPVSSLPAADWPLDDDPTDLWWPMVRELDQFTAVSPEGSVTLEVALAKPEPEDRGPVTEVGQVVAYSRRGRSWIDGSFPGAAVVSTFDLTWDDRPIDIPRRFWSDLAGFRLQTLSVDLGSLDSELRTRASTYIASLEQPRVVRSADEGTVLIEWDRREEGEARSTFRWVVSRSGTVLRHRQRSLHEG